MGLGDWLQDTWNDWTGKTDADRAKENAMNVGAATAGTYEQFAKSQEAGYAALGPWLQKALAEAQANMGQRFGLYDTAQQQGISSLKAGLQSAVGSAQAADAGKERLVREGMGMDRATLMDFLNRALAAQAPYSGAYQQMLGAALPQVLGAMQGTSRMPLSSLAQLQQEDSARSLRAGVQRAGLEGSGMASAQTASANRRIAAEDEQRQMDRWMSLLTQGLGGQGIASGTINQYASAAGSLGNRLSSAAPTSMADFYMRNAQDVSNLYGTTATRKAESIQQANIPQQYANMGQFYAGQIMDPARSRMTGTLNNVNAQGAAGQIMGPTAFQSIGDLAKLYGATQGFGGGGNYGYFGSGDFWGSKDYALKNAVAGGGR